MVSYMYVGSLVLLSLFHPPPFPSDESPQWNTVDRVHTLGCSTVIRGDFVGLRFHSFVLCVCVCVSPHMHAAACTFSTHNYSNSLIILLLFFQMAKVLFNTWHLFSMDLIVKNTLDIKPHGNSKKQLSNTLSQIP